MSMRLVREWEELEEDDEGEITRLAGAPYTGLAVDLDDLGYLRAVAEIEEGRMHGYAFDLERSPAGLIPVSVDEWTRGKEFGLSADWEHGRLVRAERQQFGVPDQELEAATRAVRRLAEGEAQVARLRALAVDAGRVRPVLTEDAAALLRRFEERWPRIVGEARAGLETR